MTLVVGADPTRQRACARSGHRFRIVNGFGRRDEVQDDSYALVDGMLHVVCCRVCGGAPRPVADEGPIGSCYRCTAHPTIWVGDIGACARHFLDAQGGTYTIGEPVKPLA